MSIITKKKTKQVFGALLGLRSESKIEVFYSFEFLNLTPENQTPKFDLEFIENRKSLTDQLFQSQNYELIGFYFTFEDPSKVNKASFYLSEIEAVMTKYSVSNPVCLILGTDLEQKDELPVDFYVSSFFSQSEKNEFEKIPHKIEGSDSERITLDTVMKFSEKAEKESAAKQNLKAFKNALDVLKFDLSQILEAASKEGNKKDPKFQALLADVVANFPSNNSARMNQIIEDKNYENSVMNGLCSCTLNKVYVKNFELMNNVANNKF